MYDNKWFTKPPVGTQLNKSHPLNRELVGYWLLNEKSGTVAYDISGNSNNGTLTNFALSGSTSNWSGSQMGGGLFCDGANDYVSIPTSTTMNPTGTGCSVIVWVNYNSLTPAYSGVFGRIVSGGSKYHMLWVKSNGKLATFFSCGSLKTMDGTGSYTLVTNKWYQLALTYDSLRGLQTWVNGQLDSTTTPNGNVSTNPVNVAIGIELISSVPTTTRASNAIFDEVRFYNRGLVQSEIQQLYVNPHIDFMSNKSLIV